MPNPPVPMRDLQGGTRSANLFVQAAFGTGWRWSSTLVD